MGVGVLVVAVVVVVGETAGVVAVAGVVVVVDLVVVCVVESDVVDVRESVGVLGDAGSK